MLGMGAFRDGKSHDDLAARCLRSQDAAVVHVAFIDDLLLPVGGPKPVSQDETLQFLADLIGAGWF